MDCERQLASRRIGTAGGKLVRGRGKGREDCGLAWDQPVPRQCLQGSRPCLLGRLERMNLCYVFLRSVKREAALPPVSPPKAALSEEELEKKSRAIIEEYLHLNDMKASRRSGLSEGWQGGWEGACADRQGWRV